MSVLASRHAPAHSDGAPCVGPPVAPPAKEHPEYAMPQLDMTEVLVWRMRATVGRRSRGCLRAPSTLLCGVVIWEGFLRFSRRTAGRAEAPLGASATPIDVVGLRRHGATCGGDHDSKRNPPHQRAQGFQRLSQGQASNGVGTTPCKGTLKPGTRNLSRSGLRDRSVWRVWQPWGPPSARIARKAKGPELARSRFMIQESCCMAHLRITKK